MNRALLSTLAAVAAFAAAPAAHAADFFPSTPGMPNNNFIVSEDETTGDVSAYIGNIVKAGSIADPAPFTDTFSFIIDLSGLGSGTLATSTSVAFNRNDLDITSVFINSLQAIKSFSADGLSETFTLSGVPIIGGQENKITIVGLSRGNGSYGGNISFSPAVPETGTWAMMIIGFGAVGAAMRYRRRQTKVAYAAA